MEEPRDGALDGLEIRMSGVGIRIGLRVRPGARTSRIDGVHGRVLKISVAAPPEQGKANAEVERLLAEELGLRRAQVSVASGHASRDKVVEISGIGAAQARIRLAAAMQAGG